MLDVRQADDPGFVPDSVRIPLDELLNRLSELPPPYEELVIAHVDPIAIEARALLEAGGRRCSLEPAQATEQCAQPGRLWSPNPLLERAVLPETGTALDLGCGAGRDSVALAACGWTVHAVDRLESSVRRTKELASRTLDPGKLELLTTLVADARTAQLGGPYDLITLFSWWDGGMAPRLPSLLSPGGTLLVEAFAPEHRLVHGRPGPHAVVSPDELMRALSPLSAALLESGPRGDRITVRAIFTK